ncbi:MAG TPA: hypothetical protein VK008_06265 [Sphingobacteriaceae bacterium]|nr:hypothetical protein [Sphingobacteriaceae bacterium]
MAGIKGLIWFFLLIHGGWGLVLGPLALVVAMAMLWIPLAKREGLLPPMSVDSSPATLDAGPWRWLNISPDFGLTREMAKEHVLRGADLWHLAATKSLQQEFLQFK